MSSTPRLPEPTPDSMPRTRGDCLPGGRNAARPCPWLTCRANLAAEGGTTESCALDVVDEYPGGLTHDAVGKLLGGLTRERVRQLEAAALAKVRKRAAGRAAHAGLLELALLPDDPPVRAPSR